MKRLTDEQRLLADQNRGIAFDVAKRFYSRTKCYDDMSDLVGVALLALCDAAAKWSADVRKFDSYAFKACRNAVRSYLNDQGLIQTPVYLSQAGSRTHPLQRYRSAAISAISLNDELKGGSERWANNDPADRMIADEVAMAAKTLPTMERRCVDFWMAGITLGKAGEELGCDHETVRRTRNRGLRMLREKFSGDAA